MADTPHRKSPKSVDLLRDNIDLTIADRRTLHAFAAFLRYAGPHRKGSVVRVHKQWQDWLQGRGPCPDPDSEVGPTPYKAPDAEG